MATNPIEMQTDWSWQRYAACRGLDPEAFFPGDDEPAPIKAVCASCPVRSSCLAFAIQRNEKYGIWGGLTSKERATLDPAARGAVFDAAAAEAGAHSAA